MLVEFSPHPFSEGLRAELIKWSLIIGPFALVIGVVTLVHTHTIRIKRRVEHWQYSYLVFIGMIVMVAFGLPTGPKNEVFEWLFDNVQVPMEATMFSLLAFFIASASYRAFRARTLEATLLLVAALIVMIGNAPIGDLLWNKLDSVVEIIPVLEHIPALEHIIPVLEQIIPVLEHIPENIPSTARQWILDNPNLSSRRGIILGVSLGVISQSIRIIFGIERSYLGGGD